MTKLQILSIQPEAGTLNAKLYFGENIKDTKSNKHIPIGIFLENIQGDTYQEYAFKIRALKEKGATKDEIQEAKKNVPHVCISGYGKHRTNIGITEHSNFIGIDCDGIDVATMKKLLRHDPYVYAIFISISGAGLCIIFKIDGKKHLESFLGLQEYLFEKYRLLIDESCKEISRARYVSYDPGMSLNEGSKVFKEYPKKETAAVKANKIAPAIGLSKDFENVILKEIEERKVDLVPSYAQWRTVAFALANQFKEGGRDYFHRISAFGNYVKADCDKLYNACLHYDSSPASGKPVATINHLYSLCKSAGIAIESEETAKIKKAAYTLKKAGVVFGSIIKNLEQHQGLAPENTYDIVKQVCEKDIYIEDVTDIECIIEYLKNNYSLRLNEITGILENNGKELYNRDVHTIELEIKNKFPKTDYTTISKIMDSSFIEKFNEIFEYFGKNKDRLKLGSIEKLFSCIKTTTGTPFCEDPEEGTGGEDYAVYFGKKWLVGMIANLFENVSPLMLVLCGSRQGTGKTYFFQHFLPKELQKYCTIKNLSSLGSDTFKRDMDIAISRYWLIYDDEMAGKSKRDQGAIKALLSTDGTNVRAAYARTEEFRKRIAAFGGTTNDLQILGDYTGNRRFIPIEVENIDQEEKDLIDPVDYIMEAYHLYQNGFDYKLSTKDIQLLNRCTQQFTQISTEFEMVVRYYKAPSNKTQTDAVYLTATDIKNKLEELTKEKMNPNKLAAALKAIGIEGERKKYNGVVASWYFVVETNIDFKEEFKANEAAFFPTTLPF